MSMLVAPYSPRARANARTTPARIPSLHVGIFILQKMNVFESPSVRPASLSVVSKASKAPRVVLYIRGNATTVAATIPPYQVITNLIPNFCRNCPSGVFTPKMSMRKNPTTVGGSTKGSVRMTSRIPLTTGCIFATT